MHASYKQHFVAIFISCNVYAQKLMRAKDPTERPTHNCVRMQSAAGAYMANHQIPDT